MSHQKGPKYHILGDNDRCRPCFTTVQPEGGVCRKRSRIERGPKASIQPLSRVSTLITTASAPPQRAPPAPISCPGCLGGDKNRGANPAQAGVTRSHTLFPATVRAFEVPGRCRFHGLHPDLLPARTVHTVHICNTVLLIQVPPHRQLNMKPSPANFVCMNNHRRI
jgi:hypothetical protein